jgi:hypothetical protein
MFSAPFLLQLQASASNISGSGSNAITDPDEPTSLESSNEYIPKLAPTSMTTIPG